MATARSVAIIGAGIGGLTAANALMRLGLSVSLYERFPCFVPTSGAGFGLQPNGQISLEHIGFPTVKDIIQPFRQWRVIGPDGQILNVSNRLNDYETRFGYCIGGALRADLVDILRKPIEQANALHYSHIAKNIEQDSSGVTVTFINNDQEKKVKADMLIGADGIHSTVVKEIFGQSIPPIFSKENIFYGVIDNIDQLQMIDPSARANNTITQCFYHGEFISYGMGKEGTFMWAATYPADAPPQSTNDSEWTIMNNQRELNMILQKYPTTHPIHQFSAATNQGRLLHFGLFYREHRNDGWHRGRIGLLGDACHATLPYVGQGANMAIEDGVVLAQCLEKNNFQIENTFQDYYNKRFERTKRMVNMARYMGLFFHSENFFVRSIRRKAIPWLMNSDMMIKAAEKEMYVHCPIPMKQKS